MSLKGQTVLVTGSSGLFGVNLINRLARDGAKVRATVHKRTRDPVPGVEYFQCDLTKHESSARETQYQDQFEAAELLTLDDGLGPIRVVLLNARRCRRQ